MLEKLAHRREALLEQKNDIDHALQELDRIVANAEQALEGIESGQRKVRHG